MIIKKLIFITFLVLIILLPLSLAKTDDSTTFILFGHVYSDYSALNKSIEKINTIKPDFVVFLGDSVVSGDNPKKAWEEFFKIVDNIESDIYIVPGNHDVENENSLKYFKENTSNLTYDFSYKISL